MPQALLRLQTFTKQSVWEPHTLFISVRILLYNEEYIKEIMALHRCEIVKFYYSASVRIVSAYKINIQSFINNFYFYIFWCKFKNEILKIKNWLFKSALN